MTVVALLNVGFPCFSASNLIGVSSIQLDEREIYWKQHYNSINTGLNCNYYDYSPMKGKQHNDETKQKISKSKIGHPCYNNPERGKKISKTNTGVKQSKETCINKSLSAKGKPKPDGFGKKISNLKKGKPLGKMSNEHKLNISKNLLGVLSKPILQYDKQDNFIKEWSSIREANISLNKNKDGGSIPSNLRGKLKTAYGFIWKYKIT